MKTNIYITPGQVFTGPPTQPAMGYGYEMIDRYLRNNLDDGDYAEYSAALDSVTSPPIAQPVGQLCEDEFGRGQVMWFSKPADGSMLHASPPITRPVQPAAAAKIMEMIEAAKSVLPQLCDTSSRGLKDVHRLRTSLADLEAALAQPVQPAPVIVAPDADADAMNGLHGESYGVDWVYPPKPQSAQPVEPAAQEAVAWMTEDGRVATTATKAVMASSSQVNFNVPLYARLALSQPSLSKYGNQELQALILQNLAQPAEPDNLTIAYMSGFADGKKVAQTGQPAATVIKRGADRQWMSEALGHLPDGTYSLYLQPAQPTAINGWKLVPNCLTPAMRCELLNATGLETTELYTMLLAAAPCPPSAQPVQQGEQKTQSFGEKYPRNPGAKCKCEHWQACIDCHPTYTNAAIKGEL